MNNFDKIWEKFYAYKHPYDVKCVDYDDYQYVVKYNIKKTPSVKEYRDMINDIKKMKSILNRNIIIDHRGKI